MISNLAEQGVSFFFRREEGPKKVLFIVHEQVDEYAKRGVYFMGTLLEKLDPIPERLVQRATSIATVEGKTINLDSSSVAILINYGDETDCRLVHICFLPEDMSHTQH